MNITNNNQPKLNSVSGVYNNNSTMCLEYILITKGMIMKKIKLTKKQLKILKHSLEEYNQFLCNIDEEQYIENQKVFGKNLRDNLQRIERKLYG
tara:strand:- start:552 stop:833 length:282 start_codon:yes stop_codon:yes gene_type:complete